MASELRDTIPTFGNEAKEESGGVSISNWSALTSGNFARSGTELLAIIVTAVLVVGGLELWVRAGDVKTYVLPRPSEVGSALFHHFDDLFWPHVKITLYELGIGYAIGASIGILLAAVITQVPFVEKIITPYILLMVTTPMMALVPLLQLQYGFTSTPRIIPIALAAGPMVMINSATGFRRTDLAKIALARSYGASTFQVFRKVRFPLALPMIIVGLMVGAIFGVLTAVGAQMVSGRDGLGNQIIYWQTFSRFDYVWAIIAILAMMGILIYVTFYQIGKRWASWQA